MTTAALEILDADETTTEACTVCKAEFDEQELDGGCCPDCREAEGSKDAAAELQAEVEAEVEELRSQLADALARLRDAKAEARRAEKAFDRRWN